MFCQVLIRPGNPARRRRFSDRSDRREVKAASASACWPVWAVLPHLQAGTLEAVPLTRTGFHRQWKGVVIAGGAPEYIPEFTRLLARGPGATVKPGSVDARPAAPRRMSVVP